MANTWHVIRLETNNGERIGILEQAPVGWAKILAGPLSENEADTVCRHFSRELGIPTFNNDVDWEMV